MSSSWIKLMLAVILAQPAPLGWAQSPSKSPPPTEDCDHRDEDFDKEIQKLRKSYPKASEKCAEALQQQIKKCGTVEQEDKQCKEAGATSVQPVGSFQPSKLSDQASNLVKARNCASKKAECFRQVGDDQKGPCVEGLTDEEKVDTKRLNGQVWRKSHLARKCLERQGREFETSAQESLAAVKAMEDDGHGGDLRSVSCANKYSGRECVFDSAGNGERLRPADTTMASPAEKGAGVAQLEDCSGTALAGGEHISTATHCVSRAEGPREIQVTDRDGNVETRTATCGAGPSTVGAGNAGLREVTICSLNQPVNAPDNYMLVRDDTLAACQNVGYERRCPTSEIAKLENSRVTISGYTPDVNGRSILHHSEGYLRYDPVTGQVFTTGPTGQGLSGGGYLVYRDGYRIIAAPHVGADRTYNPIGGYSYVPTPSEIEQARRASGIAPQILVSGQPLMREIYLGDMGVP